MTQTAPAPPQPPDGRGLRLTYSATPVGALPGCPGRIELDVDHSQGGWTSACEIALTLSCEAPGCWWSADAWDGPVDAGLLAAAHAAHDASALARAEQDRT